MQVPQLSKLGRSVLISAGAVAIVVGLKALFPDADFTELQIAVLTGVSGVVVAMVREANK